MCVAPHTSNWDFIIGEVCIRSVGRTAGFLMKDTWFFFPLGYLLRAIGGIPVSRKRRTHVTDSVVEAFKSDDRLMVAVTPEGTRSRNANWHTGFLHIARKADVPVVMGTIDYESRLVKIEKPFYPSADVEADMEKIKEYFSTRGHIAKYPDKFTV